MQELTVSLVDHLDQLEDILLESARLPFTGKRLVNEQETLELLDLIRDELPEEVNKASQLMRSKVEFTNTFKKQAEDIIQSAIHKRDQLVNSAGIQEEAQRIINELKDDTRNQCEQLLHTTRQQSARLELEAQSKLADLENTYTLRRNKLEEEFSNRKRSIELDLIQIKKDLSINHEKQLNMASFELDKIRNETHSLKNVAQAEAERITKDAINYGHRIHQQCESLLLNTRKEAANLKEGANQYADQTLQELEQRVNEINKIVLAGRNEINKLQIIQNQQLDATDSNRRKMIPFKRPRSNSYTQKAVNGNN